MTPIIEKIKKLLALSKSSNANEAATAAALAQRLMAQHRLQPADVLDGPELTLLDPIPLIVWKSRRLPPTWVSGMAARLSALNGCAIIMDRIGYDQWALKVSGQKTDVEALRFMFAWLLSEVTRLTEANYHAHMLPDVFTAIRKQRGKGFVRMLKNSYRHGCVAGALDAMTQANEVAKAEASGQGIVVRDDRHEAALGLLKALHPDGKQDDRSVRVNAAAAAAGRQAGSHLHSSKPLGAGGAKMLGDGK